MIDMFTVVMMTAIIEEQNMGMEMIMVMIMVMIMATIMVLNMMMISMIFWL